MKKQKIYLPAYFGKTNWVTVLCWVAYPACVIVLCLFLLFSCLSCTTPKIIEQHHHHSYEADTLAIQAQVDKRMNGWHTQMDSTWRQRIDEYSASWFSHDDEKETITETITTYIDSLGREVRQEQRTTDRSLSRMQQQTEQRLTREFELRLSVVVDSVNDIWQQRFNALQTHMEKSDSTSNTQTPVAVNQDNRPWYKRWWQTIKGILIGAALFAAIWFTRKWWTKLIKP